MPEKGSFPVEGNKELARPETLEEYYRQIVDKIDETMGQLEVDPPGSETLAIGVGAETKYVPIGLDEGHKAWLGMEPDWKLQAKLWRVEDDFSDTEGLHNHVSRGVILAPVIDDVVRLDKRDLLLNILEFKVENGEEGFEVGQYNEETLWRLLDIMRETLAQLSRPEENPAPEIILSPLNPTYTDWLVYDVHGREALTEEAHENCRGLLESIIQMTEADDNRPDRLGPYGTYATDAFEYGSIRTHEETLPIYLQAEGYTRDERLKRGALHISFGEELTTKQLDDGVFKSEFVSIEYGFGGRVIEGGQPADGYRFSDAQGLVERSPTSWLTWK